VHDETTEILVEIAKLQTQMLGIAEDVQDIKTASTKVAKGVEDNRLAIAVNAAKGHKALVAAVVSALGALFAVALRFVHR